MNPLLKCAGGKRWLAPKVKELYKYFPDHRVVEPFAGGMAVTLLETPILE